MDSGVLSALPREIRDIISHEEQKLALNRRFTREEIGWLIETRRFFSVTYCGDTACATEYYASGIDGELWMEENFHLKSHLITWYSRGDVHFAFGAIYDVTSSELVDRLEGSFDTHLRNNLDYVIGLNNEEIASRVCLLDIRSIFLLLRKRAQEAGFLHPVVVAKRETLAFLERLVASLTTVGAFLKTYLMASALCMELDVPISWTDGKMPKTEQRGIRDRCEEYIAAIRQELS